MLVKKSGYKYTFTMLDSGQASLSYRACKIQNIQKERLVQENNVLAIMVVKTMV